jgi:hypothetical protein
MAKRIKYKTGDIFSIEVGNNEFVFGRVLFDTKEQYIKKLSPDEQKSYFNFFSNCFLMETYNGVFDTLDKVDYKKIAVKSNFVSKDIFKRDDVKILHNIPVDPKNVTFPEVITTFNSDYFFSVGELNIPIKITSKERDDIHVYPSYGSGYWEMVATLVYSNRPDLIEEKNIFKIKVFTLQVRIYG